MKKRTEKNLDWTDQSLDEHLDHFFYYFFYSFATLNTIAYIQLQHNQIISNSYDQWATNGCLH